MMKSIKCSSVEICEKEVSEFDKNLKVVSIQRADIEEIELKCGFATERAIVQGIIGFVLISIGLVLGMNPIFRMVITEDYPSNYYSLKIFCFAIPLIFIGGHIFITILKRRNYLLIKSGGKERKVIFQDKVSKNELNNFIKDAKVKFGYNILLDRRDI